MTVGPDDFTEHTTEELTEHDLEVLSTVWPGAFLAVSSLLLMVDDGSVDKETPFMAMNLFDLVHASFENPEEMK